MVQQSEIINILCNNFIYRDKTLYWAKGPRKGSIAGSRNKNGYIDVRISDLNNIIIQAHRIIFMIHHKYVPELVDHIDRNPFNNCISNLREANRTINAINTGLSSSNKSGIKGVYKHLEKWEAFINIKVEGKRKKIHLGRFDNKNDAIYARQQAERHYWPKF